MTDPRRPPGSGPAPSRSVSDKALVVIGVLYPFIVYFGEGRVPTPVMGAVLAGLWLLRARSLLRQPGGRWMLGIALAYCGLLMLAPGEALMRWYPTLVSAVLFVGFAYSLRYGPPMIERLARMMEPDLPPAAVPYTRKVTWVWMAFFAINGSIAAVLAAWAPVGWWTLYTGVIAYVATGALFAGEWLVRLRLRHRIRHAPMQGAAARLHSHPWVAAAEGGRAGKQGPGMVVALSPSGCLALQRHGRAGLVGELGQHAAGDDPLSTPLVWRFVGALPSGADVGALLAAPMPEQPVILGRRNEGDTHLIDLELPLDLVCFVDHFPMSPVVPGVLQLKWALAFADSELGIGPASGAADALKFQRLLRPGDHVTLALRHDAGQSRLHFAWHAQGECCSSGVLRLERQHAG
jgi:uncharacterized membrane protein/3-hydroxymyristoyl/3-hydroxydecanoyl-(acyl carrier protein) dehydratase